MSVTNNRRNWIVAGAVALVVVVAAVIAIVVSGGGDGSDDAVVDSSTVTTQGTNEQEPGGGGSADSLAVAQPIDFGNSVGLPALEQGAPDGAIGLAAPSMEGFSFDGTPVSITPGDGQPVLLVFLAHWCPHCNAELPRLVEWNATGRVPEGLRVVAVSTAMSPERPNYPPGPWLLGNGWPFEAMADTDTYAAAQYYGVSGFPFMVMIGGDGTVSARTSGEHTIDEIDSFVRDALTPG